MVNPYRPLSLHALLGLSVIAFATAGSALLAGCASSSPPASSETAASLTPPAAARSLRAELRTWEGTPYRMGGTTRSGVDCSALVMFLYRDAFDVTLPRTTRTQVLEGDRVAQNNLRPGDLVFFRPAKKTRHVGIYLGKNTFAHASSSQGVTTTSLNHPYWQESYWTARRILSLETPATAVSRDASPSETASSETTSSETAPGSPTTRAGW